MLPEGGQKPSPAKSTRISPITFDQAWRLRLQVQTATYGMGAGWHDRGRRCTNVDQAKAATHPGKAKQAFATLFEKLAATQTAESTHQKLVMPAAMLLYGGGVDTFVHSKGAAVAPILGLARLQGPALLSGFRPFFFFGSAYAGVAILAWLPQFYGELALSTSFAPRLARS